MYCVQQVVIVSGAYHNETQTVLTHTPQTADRLSGMAADAHRTINLCGMTSANRHRFYYSLVISVSAISCEFTDALSLSLSNSISHGS